MIALKNFSKYCIDDSTSFFKSTGSNIFLGVSKRSALNGACFYGRYSDDLNILLENKMLKLYGKKVSSIGELRDSREYSCRILSSGMQALISMFFIFSPFRNKKFKVLVAQDFYFEFVEYVNKFNELNIEFVDMDSEQDLIDKIDDSVCLFFIEPAPAPFFKKRDMKKICTLVHTINPFIQIVVDNTVLTPYYYNPFDDGADICIDSLSKYINGHGDVIGGSIVLPTVLLKGVCFSDLNLIGTKLDPFSSYLVNRGIKTFPIRMNKITLNACGVYDYLISLEFIELLGGKIDVRYAGVCGVICFSLGNDLSHQLFVESLRFIQKGCTFGTESTLCDFCTRSFLSEKWASFIRISVGLEELDLILDDIRGAFKSVLQRFIFIEDKEGFFVAVEREGY